MSSEYQVGPALSVFASEIDTCQSLTNYWSNGEIEMWSLLLFVCVKRMADFRFGLMTKVKLTLTWQLLRAQSVSGAVNLTESSQFLGVKLTGLLDLGPALPVFVFPLSFNDSILPFLMNRLLRLIMHEN